MDTSCIDTIEIADINKLAYGWFPIRLWYFKTVRFIETTKWSNVLHSLQCKNLPIVDCWQRDIQYHKTLTLFGLFQGYLHALFIVEWHYAVVASSVQMEKDPTLKMKSCKITDPAFQMCPAKIFVGSFPALIEISELRSCEVWFKYANLNISLIPASEMYVCARLQLKHCWYFLSLFPSRSLTANVEAMQLVHAWWNINQLSLATQQYKIKHETKKDSSQPCSFYLTKLNLLFQSNL